MNLPLLIPCIAAFVLSSPIAPELEIGVPGMQDAQVMPQEKALQVGLASIPDMLGVCSLDSLERFDGVEEHNAIAKEKLKAKAERKRRTEADAQFGMLVLLLHILQDAR